MRCLLRPTDYTTHGTQCSAHSLIKKKRTQEYKNLFIILEKKKRTCLYIVSFVCLFLSEYTYRNQCTKVSPW